MSKSKYPSQIDTSLELPVIKDNLTELRATIFNSYRSAIIQLEKTLGINPQGYEGNTIAERLNMSLDEYGLLKDEAIDKLNLIKGPVKNSNIANEAGIKESKLDLDFSTNFLYNQVVVLKRFLDEIDSAINDISTKLSTHLNIASLDSHIAKAITIEEDVSSPQSTVALNSLEEQTLQEFAQKIIFSHVNLLGTGLSSSNNSHKADQIYFDNDPVQDIISSNSVQKAIEELANLESSAIQRLIINLAKNSRLRSGKTSNPESALDSRVALNSFDFNVNIIEGKKKFIVSLDSPKAESLTITDGDFIRITGYSELEFNGDYLIDSVSRNSSGEVESISVFGFLPKTQTSGLRGQVLKNNISYYNSAGFHHGIRYLKNYTNLPYVIYADPNSAKITASNSRIHNITSSANLTIEIDGSSVTIDVFDSDVYSSLGYVTLDSIINKINKYSSENSLLIFATYSYVKSKKELAIVHLIPNISEDLNTRSLKITASSSNDASENLGFSSLLDIVFYGSGSNSSIINGKLTDEYFDYKKLTSGFFLNKSTSTITRSAGSFVEDGFLSGSLILIENALSAADNGIFVIKKSETNSLTIDHFFNDGISIDTSIMSLNNVVDLSEFEFDNLGTSDLITTSGSILFNSFYDSYSGNVFVKKRLEIENLSKSFGTNNSLSILDISKNFIKSGQTGSITIDTNFEVFLTDASGAVGESVLITNSGRYVIYDRLKQNYIVLELFISSLSLLSDYVINLYGYNDLSSNTLKIGSFLYSTQLGKTIGDAESLGVPSLENMVDTGYVDEDKISENFYLKYINLPREELIGDGVVFGLKTTFVSWDDATKVVTFNLEGGVCYVGGKRLEISQKDNLTFTLDSTNNHYWYLFINENAEIKLEKEITFNSEKYSTIFNQDVVTLSYFYQETSASEFFDLRYFIDKTTKKLSREIIVSPSSISSSSIVTISKNESHFNSLKDAVKYCKKIKYANGNSFTPRIVLLEGYHYLSSTLYIDFDLEIYGTNNKSFIKPKSSSSIVGRSSLLTDLTDRHTLSTDNSMISVGKYGTTTSQYCNYLKIKNVNFESRYSSNLKSILYINEHFNKNKEDKLIIEGCNFFASTSDFINLPYSSGDPIYFSIPILITNPTSSDNPNSFIYNGLGGDYEFNRSFQNMYFYNNTFHNFKTNGYCILFQVYDYNLSGAYQAKNIVGRDNLIKNSRQHYTLSTNQLFSFVKNIEDVKLVDSNHITFTNVIEENTMVEV